MIKLYSLDEIIDKNINNPWFIVIGMIASGKSHIIKEIHKYNKKNVLASVVICPQERLYEFYINFIEDKYIYNQHYDSSILNRILDRQKLLMNTLNYKTEVIFDDSLSANGKWIKNNDIKYLFNNREEHKLTIIMSFKYSMGFDVEMRNKYDYVFLLHEHFHITRKRLYEHYAYKIFDNYEDFDKIMMFELKRFDCLVLDMRNKKYFIYNSNNI
jgi:hypothetical protein